MNFFANSFEEFPKLSPSNISCSSRVEGDKKNVSEDFS